MCKHKSLSVGGLSEMYLEIAVCDDRVDFRQYSSQRSRL